MTCRWGGLILVLVTGLVLADEPLLPDSSVSGSISGLTGSGLLLIDTVSGRTLTIDAGDEEFVLALDEGAEFNIEVQIPPTEPAQDCLIVNGAGVVDATRADDIEITCTIIDEIFGHRFENTPAPLINQF